MQQGKIAISLVAITTLFLAGFFTLLTVNNPSSQADAARISIVKYKKKISAPTLSPTPTLNPTATSAPKIRDIPTSTPTPTPSDLRISISDYLLNQVNDYRKSNGLYPVASNNETCSFATTRAQEISKNFNHDGFISRVNNKTLPYPSYHEVAENIAMNSNYKEVIQQWINSPGHAENMKKDTPYVCISKYENFYAYEGWRP